MEPLIIRKRNLGLILIYLIPFVGIIEFWYLQKLRKWSGIVIGLGFIFWIISKVFESMMNSNSEFTSTFKFIFILSLPIFHFIAYYHFHNKLCDDATRKSKPYLIEIRLNGKSRFLLQKIVHRISYKFRITNATKNRYIPHVTLFGPFACNDITKVIKKINKVGLKYSELPFKMQGFGYFELEQRYGFFKKRMIKNVIYGKITPSKDLENFRHELAQELFKITDSVNIERKFHNNFHFHATIVMKNIHHKFKSIWDFLNNENLYTDGACYKITLLDRGRILREYDLTTKKCLTRRQTLNLDW